MKKLKLMLLSLTVLVVVGGTVAFKVKGIDRYCTAAPVNGSCFNVACPNDQTGNPDDTGTFICTTPTSGLSNPCKMAGGMTLPCGPSARIILD